MIVTNNCNDNTGPAVVFHRSNCDTSGAKSKVGGGVQRVK